VRLAAQAHPNRLMLFLSENIHKKRTLSYERTINNFLVQLAVPPLSILLKVTQFALEFSLLLLIFRSLLTYYNTVHIVFLFHSYHSLTVLLLKQFLQLEIFQSDQFVQWNADFPHQNIEWNLPHLPKVQFYMDFLLSY